MDIELAEGHYRSITSPFSWKDIPRFAVVTGPNGAGKSQLLEMIEAGTKSNTPTNALTKIGEHRLRPTDVIRLTANLTPSQPASTTNLAAVQRGVSNLLKKIKEPKADEWHDQLREDIEQKLGRKIAVLSDEEIINNIPSGVLFPLGNNLASLPKELEELFVGHRLRVHQFRMTDRHVDEDAIKQMIGRNPWDVLNEFFDIGGIPLRVIPPRDNLLTGSYQFRIECPQGKSVAVGNLSSGEQAVLRLVLLLFKARENHTPVRLLLLDEPDAHLHPALVSKFLKALRSILVDEFRCHVVATTHRLDTIALVPREDLFEMTRTGEPRIQAVASKSELMARLSSSLLAVLPAVRVILVEDEDDELFYSRVYRILVDEGYLESAPHMVFQRASLGDGQKKVPAGCSVVKEWVARLRNGGLNPMVTGLIDRDNGAIAGAGIHVLSRHSIENFICDPVILFTSLVGAAKVPPELSDIPVRPGDERNSIRALSSQELQRIVDVLLAPIASKLGSVELGSTPVVFQTGQQVNYPKWIITTRGHDLQAAVAGHYVNPGSKKILLSAFNRIELIPMELRDTFAAIGAAS